ncbi:MAG: hypothetical protein J0I16_12665 [Rhizobiales bacterium]|nr:hypothetical protein [Hyphomicrobiales bacterium]
MKRSVVERLTGRLRRFARALYAGSEAETADEIVRLTIEAALTADDTAGRSDIRICLFQHMIDKARAAHKAAATEPVPAEPTEDADMTIALTALRFEERAAYLLVALEEFGYADAAAVMRVPYDVLATRVAQARIRLDEFFDEAGRRAASGSARGTPPGHLRIVK